MNFFRDKHKKQDFDIRVFGNHASNFFDILVATGENGLGFGEFWVGEWKMQELVGDEILGTGGIKKFLEFAEICCLDADSLFWVEDEFFEGFCDGSGDGERRHIFEIRFICITFFVEKHFFFSFGLVQGERRLAVFNKIRQETQKIVNGFNIREREHKTKTEKG